MLAARFGLSRTTLLYYDRLGLLQPASRSSAGYRRYDSADVDRLATICRLRRAGLSLAAITRVLDSPTPELVAALAVRLADLGDQIEKLRGQQRLILAALARGQDGDRSWSLDKAELVELLSRAGLTGEQRAAWHAAAESADAALHQELLESLNLAADEVAQIRLRAAGTGDAGKADPASGTGA